VERIVRTLRCKNVNIPGTLGKLATTIGKVGVDIGNVTTVHLGPHYTIRDIDVYAENESNSRR
jgi:malate dehydrogenase (oxaloacetate-decarboxylating)